ncbi:MAG: hypothetical protein ACE5PO_08630 [Candidatus Bathyarchaeia archaeon]
MVDFVTVELCKGEFFVSPKGPVRIDFAKVREKYAITKETPFMLYLNQGNLEIHLTPQGKMVVLGETTRETVESLYRKIISDCTST